MNRDNTLDGFLGGRLFIAQPRRGFRAGHDTVLLASDGLFDNLFIDEIVDSIRTGPLKDAADRLVERAGKRMSGNGAADQPCKPDDLTIVLFRRRR